MNIKEKIETLRQLGFEVRAETEHDLYGEKYSNCDKEKIIRMTVKHPAFTGEAISWNDEPENTPIEKIIEHLIEDIVDEAREDARDKGW